MVSSFQATGEEDSAKYYVYMYKSMFPGLDVSEYGYRDTERRTEAPALNPRVMEQKHYVVQIGAFGSEANARRLKLQISQIGYSVIVALVETNGRKLHAVRVVGYSSKKAADQTGKDIKKKLGIDYRVLYRPKG